MAHFNTLDLNIDNYTLKELIGIFDLRDDFTRGELQEQFTKYMRSTSSKGQSAYMYFLQKAFGVLNGYLDTLDLGGDGDGDDNGDDNGDRDDEDEDEDDDDDDDDDDANTEGDDENEDYNENLITNFLADVPKSNNIINRKNTNTIDTDIATSNPNVMITNRLPIEQTYQVPVVRGQLNPNLKNIRTTIVNIDSQFRPDITKPSTDFTFDLSDPIYKALSICLINIEFQHAWYTFDEAYGTTSFYIDTSGSSTEIAIPNGNYPILDCITLLNTQILTTFSQQVIDFSYNPYTHRTTITNNDSSNVTLTFYDTDQYDTNPDFLNNGKINYNLGWILGFRNQQYTLTGGGSVSPSTTNTITSEGLVDLYGPRYIFICLDEFNNNNVNKGVVTMSDDITRADLPRYFTPDISASDPHFRLVNGAWVDSKLTEAQVHTILEIVASRNSGYEDRHMGLSTSKVLARVPVEHNIDYGMIYSSSSHLRYSIRNYFGPVDIQRMRVSLFTDKGQLLNLNGQDYSIAFLVEQLYQY